MNRSHGACERDSRLYGIWKTRNRRNTVRLTINGETKSVAEWAETIDISPFTICWWVRTKGEEYAEKRIAAWNRRAGEDG